MCLPDLLRSYIALPGGGPGRPLLGSGSPAAPPGTAAARLAAGTVRPGGRWPATAVGRPEPGRVTRTGTGPVDVRVVVGPRADWLAPGSRDRLLSETWTVTERSNRVGLRLDGPALERATDAELPSEGTVSGAVQLPADGRPVVFLADHPVTGGYPVVAVVREADLDLLAQLRPGDRLRLRL